MKIDLTSVVGCTAIPRGDPEAASRALRGAFHRIDIDISDLVWPGARVFLKPDFGDASPTSPQAWTDPHLLVGAARLFRELGATVLVGDSPYADGTPVRRRWEELGLRGRAAAGEFALVDIEAAPVQVAAVQDTVYFVPEPVIQADLVVNMPRLRAHPWFSVGGALTNLLGILPGFQKVRHLLRSGNDGGFGRVLADLYAIVQPGLTILQFDSLERDAKVWGGLVSEDGIAVDAAAAERIGLDQKQARHIGLAAEAGLGVGWGEGIEIDGEEVELPALPGLQYGGYPARRFFRWLGGVAEPWVWSRPDIDEEGCNGCGECVKSCPTKALRLRNGGEVPLVEPRMCVGCWHCMGVCPEGVIVSEQSGLARVLGGTKRRSCAF